MAVAVAVIVVNKYYSLVNIAAVMSRRRATVLAKEVAFMGGRWAGTGPSEHDATLNAGGWCFLMQASTS